MLHDFLVAVWFALPIGAANMAPIFAAHLPRLKHWNAPMDFRRTFRGERVLGAHKTWRGFVSGVILATLVFWAQQYLTVSAGWAANLTAGLDYPTLPTLIVGFLFALGALGGDALKSFCKRQAKVAPGKPFVPFDQIDILGGALTVMPFIMLTGWQYFWLVFFVLFGQLLFSWLGYLLGIKERPF